MSASVGLLAFFMVLTIVGISESAAVAIGIFITHMVSLSLLAVVGVVYIVTTGTATFMENMGTPTPGGWQAALFFGFAASLLGISGFENSANFVEEQAEGVFPKTLRNMWIAVGVFNPAMAFLALAIIPIGDLNDANKNALLADMGQQAGRGAWLAWIISIDAVLVLSGAVLTSFVGVTGLVHRMSLDRCLPQFLLKTNRRGTTHWIVIAFFLLCVSVLIMTKGDLLSLAGVYTLSFLAVMALFCVGNVLLKVKRAKLPRPTIAPWIYVIVAFLAVITGLVGNILMTRPAQLFHLSKSGVIEHNATIHITGPDGEMALPVSAGQTFEQVAEIVNADTQRTGVHASAGRSTLTLATLAVGADATIHAKVTRGEFELHLADDGEVTSQGADGYTNLNTFLRYFIPTVLIVSVMLGRITLLKISMFIIRGGIAALLQPLHATTQWIRDKIENINSQQVVFFTRGDNIANLNNAMLYVKNNEHTNRIKVVTVVATKDGAPPNLQRDIEFLDDVYPAIDIEFVLIVGNFGPKLINELSKKWKIPKNFMFIGSPAGHMMYGLAELGGVRLII